MWREREREGTNEKVKIELRARWPARKETESNKNVRVLKVENTLLALYYY